MVELDEVSQFLNDFSQCIIAAKIEEAAKCCMLPNIIISDNTKIELDALLLSFSQSLTQYGVIRVNPLVYQTLRLSDSLFFTNIRWQLFNDKNDIIVNWASSYTLQRTVDGKLSIIVTVIEDDQKLLHKMLPDDLRL